jgi:hypothetical protein
MIYLIQELDDFDDGASNFDGDTPANCNAHIEIALSNDNVTYTII